MLSSLVAADSSRVESLGDWLGGEFNETSAARDNVSGDLGLGYRNGSVDDDLAGFWRFDAEVSGDGGTVYDYSGRQLDGTTVNGTSTGEEGTFNTSAYSFDGSDDFVDLNSSSVPEWWKGRDISVSVWFRGTGSGVLLGNAGGEIPSASDGWVPALYVSDTGRVHGSLFWHGSTTTVNSSGSYDDGEWHHVAITFTSGTERLYVDGKKVDSRSGLSQTDYNSGDYSYFVGANRWENWPETSGRVSYYGGSIDELRVLNKSIGTAEAKELYLNGEPFEGDYSYSVGETGNRSWNELQVNATEPGVTELTAVFRSVSGGETVAEQVIDVTGGKSNYSLPVPESDTGEVEFNGSSTNASFSWEVNSFELYYSEPPTVGTVNASQPVEEGMEVNVTAEVTAGENALDQVTLNLTDAAGNLELDRAAMKEATDGRYFRSYQVNEEAGNAGEWFANVSANGTEGASDTNSTTFTVDQSEEPLYRSEGQLKDAVDPLESNELFAEGFDNVNLSYATLSTNETGSFENVTGNYSSPLEIGEGGVYRWSNFTWDNDSFQGDTLGWRIWYNDSAGSYNATPVNDFLVRATDQEPPAVTVESPLNTSIDEQEPWLNASADENIDQWRYNLDSSGNVTFDGSTLIGPLADGQHEVKVWGNDTADNWGLETRYFSVDTRLPEAGAPSDNVSGSTTEGEPVNLSSEVSDADSGIYRAKLATNETGSFSNYSSLYGSPEEFDNSTETKLADFKWENDSFSGTLGFRIWARDSAGNWNSTSTGVVEMENQINVKAVQLSSLEQWDGSFSETSVYRDDLSGDLGLGYGNGSSGDSLWSYFRMDETVSGSGGTVRDFSGRSLPATATNGVFTGVSGLFSTDSHSFDGSDDYLDLDTASVNDWYEGRDGSASIWFKGTGSGVLFSNNGGDTPSATDGWVPALYVGDSGKVHGSLFWHDTSTTVNSSASFDDGDWHHAVITYNGGTERLYVDGSQVDSRSGLVQEDYNSGDYSYFIGAGRWESWPDNVGSEGYWPGRIDEFRFYNRSLSSSEVEELYLRGSSSPGYEGNYTETVSLPPEGVPTSLELEVSGAESSGNTSWVEVSTSNGESAEFQLSSGSNSLDLDFDNRGGTADLELNFTAQQPPETPVVQSLELLTDSLTYTANATLEAGDGSVYSGASLEFQNRFGETVASGDTDSSPYLAEQLGRNVTYSYVSSGPVYDSFFEADVKYVPEADERLETQVVDNYTATLPSGVEKMKTVYALNDTYLNVSTANLTFPRFDLEANAVAHCTSWDFSAGECSAGAWQVNSSSDYGMERNSTHVWFQVEQFDAFAPADASTLPNVTNISVYRVDGLGGAEKRNGGTLTTSGLNTTLNISSSGTTTYRFDFNVSNDEQGDWNLDDPDTLYHDGVNSSWSVGEVFYNFSGDAKFGSTFSGGRVDWDTSNGGTLPGGESGVASYIVNVSQPKDSVYDQEFRVNDTSEEAGSFDQHRLNVTALGTLEVTLNDPVDGTSLLKNSFFTMNATLDCVGGECGTVEISPRYNQSPEADTIIPEGSGTPFHTKNTATRSCGELTGGQSCTETWDVNASGPGNSAHLLDANASSSRDAIEDNDSADSEVAIKESLIIDLSWSVIDFGLLDPGERNVSAPGNSDLSYNVTVDSTSPSVDQIWIRGDDLVAPGWENPVTGDSYYIDSRNVSVALSNSIDQEDPIEGNYSLLEESLEPGDNLTTFYWLDVPEGIKSEEYNGTIYFKANETA